MAHLTPRKIAMALATLGLALSLYLGVQRWTSTPRAFAGQRPNIIFIAIETLRADHLRTYGGGRNTMPVVEDLSREGVVFERAITAAPWTLPSVSSILTGLAPSVHGVTTYEDVLPDDVKTLAETFSAAGYQTAFFGVNSLFEADRNLEQGFEKYYGIDEIPGTQLNEQIAAFLYHRQDQRPLFLYVHFFEPHCRYEPPEALRGLYLPVPPALATGATITQDQLRSMHECFHLYRRSGEPILELDHYLAEYDAEIRYADHLVGLLFERLKTHGLFDSSLIAVLGDHGEEFWEHGTFGHGRSLNEAAVHIPLIVRPPGGIPAARFSAPVSTLDLAPTALAAAGLPKDRRMQGEDLTPIWAGDPDALTRRPVFSETDYETFHLRSVHLDGLKFVVQMDGDGHPNLFDLTSDPDQQVDLAPQRPADVARLGAVLEAHQKDSANKAQGVRSSQRQVSDEIIERLRSLGYTL